MLRKSCKRNPISIGKSSLDSKYSRTICDNHKTHIIRKQQQFSQLIKEITKFKNKVIKLWANKQKTNRQTHTNTHNQYKQNSRAQQKPEKSYENSLRQDQHDQLKYYNIDKIKIKPDTNRRYYVSKKTNDLAQIHLIIKGNTPHQNIDELVKKVTNLQLKNQQLSQEKHRLQKRLIQQTQQSIIKQKQQNNGQKSPFQKYNLKQSRNSHNSREKLNKKRIGTDSSLESKNNPLIIPKSIYWSRLNPHNCYIQKDPNQLPKQPYLGKSRKSEYVKPNQLNQSLHQDQYIVEKSYDNKYKDESINLSRMANNGHEYSIHQKQNRSLIHQPRITFSKDVIAPRQILSKVNSNNTIVSHSNLTMLEHRFQTLINLSQREKTKERKEKIRKEMCDIAVQIDKLKKIQ